ncbi:MAG: peptide chain release factor N(5)-glutamine methyltransferase [Roseomonas sp.]|nr:peptide chain release factor N(5)-glutamine methyltransferase [Roseomonas sp.]MCA3328353.1 peptide chain release factor N(5)-glutamine methyltransferase [Roseomonas sp.]MCA3330813.1 peptide chain release factor N(5)-glutamine methyltransferase [Roseomonas sp.]MCA3334302.1 peptide chain release factor N(5)-glutamine methyltransferase [Roseomonas sp.]MCA3347992.1 peptide chain release factor N(5)-glutamine methyltransferase [Roseomonas sp.]
MSDAPCADPAGTIGFFLCQAGQRLRGAAIEAPRLEARRLLAHVLGTTEEALLRDPRAAVPADKAQHFAALLARRVAHEPFAYLTGRVGFWTLDLEVSPATLIPRADSETLVEAALAACPDKGAALQVLDLGTGTGALLLAVLSEFSAANGIGIDLKPAAAALAARNAVRLGLAARACFLAGDWAAALAGRFDLVLCNPPYIESAAIPGLMPEVARHEPASALDGGADGLAAYRRIIADLPRLLAPRGVAVLELGAGQQAAVEALGRAAGLTPEACSADLGGVPRALVLRAA